MDGTQKYEQVHLQLTGALLILSNEDQFQKYAGFKLKEFLNQRDELAALMRGISDHIDKIACDVGAVKITGGSLGVTSGVMMGLGIVLAPFSGGASLAFTVGGACTGIASAATSLSAAICKDYHLKEKTKFADKLIKNLEPKNSKVLQIVNVIGKDLQKMKSFAKQPNFIQWIQFVSQKGMKLYNVIFKGYKTATLSINIVQFTRELAVLIKLNCQIMKGLALQASSPCLKLFGNVIISTGSKAATCLAAFGAILGIFTGSLQIAEGAKQFKGTQEAHSMREISFEWDAVTRQIDHIINTGRQMAGLQRFNRKREYVLISVHSGKAFDFRPPIYAAHLWEICNVKNQRIEIGSGFTIHMKNVSNNLYASCSSLQNGAKIQQKQFKGDKLQSFYLVPTPDGKPNEYFIQCGGKLIDVAESGCSNGNGILLWDKNGEKNQRWYLCSLYKQKVSDYDSQGLGNYFGNMAGQGFDFLVKKPVEGTAKFVQSVGSATGDTLGLRNRTSYKCSKCKDDLYATPYLVGNDNYAQCNSCGKYNSFNDQYIYCKNCSVWGFCRQCAQKGIVPFGCDTKKCNKCTKQELKSYKYYGMNWDYVNCNNCKSSIGMNCFYWYCSYCKTWGYCYQCTMEGKCGIKG